MESENWRLEKSKKGVKIYTKPNQGSNYRAYRAEMTVAGSMLPYLTVFDNVSGYKDWMHTTIQSELLEQPQDNIKHIYMVNRNFPIVDRDYYAELETTQKECGTIEVSWKLLDKPTTQGKVRVNKLDVLISLVPLDSDKFKVVLAGHFEPGGMVPAALANAFITDVPYNTFLKIRKLASRHSEKDLVVPSYVQL